ncbi:MAG: SMI1/KNR4 family protein [Acaryochloridaceae cyanobacterium CSU_3_4]|nr:SMI1/KNR4 family protein [Acaryochloridaceae cyanobacterium CSU_3_4]
MRFHNDNKPPLASEALTELEQQIRYRLPEDYRSFLIRHNGGQPEHQFLSIPDCHDEVLIDIF